MSSDSGIQALYEKVAEQYSQKLWLRAIVQSIPYAGGLDTILSYRGAEIVARRQEELFQAFKTEMAAWQEHAVDHAFLHSDDFLHLVIRAMDHAMRTKRKERIQVIARALASSASQEWGAKRVDDSEILLDIAATLLPDEIAGLETVLGIYKDRMVYREQNAPRTRSEEWTSVNGRERIEEVPDSVILRLKAKGLVMEHILATWGGNTVSSFEPTELATQLVGFLQNHTK